MIVSTLYFLHTPPTRPKLQYFTDMFMWKNILWKTYCGKTHDFEAYYQTQSGFCGQAQVFILFQP